MTKDFEHKEPAQENENPLHDEQWRNSIPAQVFLNHYFSINYHIKHTGNRYDLNRIPFFNRLGESGEAMDTDRITRLLCNAWSTEFAMRSTAQLSNEEYLRYALHWTFPQAYYSVFLGLQAWMAAKGMRSRSYDVLHREFGKLVASGAYPHSISFYADGHYERFHLHRLRASNYKPGLLTPAHEMEAEAELGQFLCTTRKMKAWGVRNAMQANPATVLTTKNGKVLQKFSQKDWEKVTPYVGNTTIMDLMGRLRMSASHKEIDRFVMADIDFALFHQSLCEIVSYMNFVHEAYIAKAMGIENYRNLVYNLPPFLRNSFVSRRLEKYIEPLFGGERAKLAA